MNNLHVLLSLCLLRKLTASKMGKWDSQAWVSLTLVSYQCCPTCYVNIYFWSTAAWDQRFLSYCSWIQTTKAYITCDSEEGFFFLILAHTRFSSHMESIQHYRNYNCPSTLLPTRGWAQWIVASLLAIQPWSKRDEASPDQGQRLPYSSLLLWRPCCYRHHTEHWLSEERMRGKKEGREGRREGNKERIPPPTCFLIVSMGWEK